MQEMLLFLSISRHLGFVNFNRVIKLLFVITITDLNCYVCANCTFYKNNLNYYFLRVKPKTFKKI